MKLHMVHVGKAKERQRGICGSLLDDMQGELCVMFDAATCPTCLGMVDWREAVVAQLSDVLPHVSVEFARVLRDKDTSGWTIDRLDGGGGPFLEPSWRVTTHKHIGLTPYLPVVSCAGRSWLVARFLEQWSWSEIIDGLVGETWSFSYASDSLLVAVASAVLSPVAGGVAS